jgi:glyoxalase family protein
MRLDGIHHVTAITADAQRNVDFYAGVLGLRLVKKTVNQDNPTVYHLFYADEKGDPGSDLTFFEYPGIPVGRAGDGMVHRIVWRVGSADALDFWAGRLEEREVQTHRVGGRLRFADPEGLEHELLVAEVDDQPLVAEHPEIPVELALQGFDGVRAYASDPDRSAQLLAETLEFSSRGQVKDGVVWEARGERRGSIYTYDEPPTETGLQGAGTVHHVAWASTVEEHETWRDRVVEAGMRPTPVIDRFYFRSVYFREPSGVLFEIATIGPGFATDEPADKLGERLSLPPAFEHLRDRLEPVLTPLPNPREARAAR